MNYKTRLEISKAKAQHSSDTRLSGRGRRSGLRVSMLRATSIGLVKLSIGLSSLCRCSEISTPSCPASLRLLHPPPSSQHDRLTPSSSLAIHVSIHIIPAATSPPSQRSRLQTSNILQRRNSRSGRVVEFALVVPSIVRRSLDVVAVRAVATTHLTDLA